MAFTRLSWCRLMVAALGINALPASGKSPAAAPEPVERHDLRHSFAAAFCPGGLATPAQELWRHGIYDAGIEGRQVKPIGRQSISLESMQKRALTLAKVRRYQGYAAAVCPDGRGLAIATPAPAAIVLGSSELKLPLAALSEQCRSFRVDFAASSSTKVAKLEPKGELVDVRHLGAGAVSLTCQPHKPDWSGPVLWALVKVGNDSADTLPEVGALGSGSSTKEQLLSWINSVRRNAKLAPLETNSSLDEQAELLAISKSLRHNRKQLHKSKAQLDNAALRLIGENRVRGKKSSDLAWLLWTSPRHRELLLNTEANSIGLATSPTADGVLAVLALAEHDKKALAKKPATPAEPSSKKLQ